MDLEICYEIFKADKHTYLWYVIIVRLDLEDNIETIHIDREKLLGELYGLDDNIQQSLSMSGKVCRRCGKLL